MTNPTSNFNWQMPTPTDLVTDLPADFEVFGQAVDTSMADLLGGTTGQILAKASNSNMDFAWITNDVGDITAVNVTSPITGGGSSGAVTIGINAATTSVVGAVQLSDSTSTTSSVLASTPTATKAAYDLADAAIAKSTVTTAGDIIYRNATVPTRLGIGTAGQVLQVNSGATAPEWATPAGGGGWTLASTTALSGASTSLTIPSGYKQVVVLVDNYQLTASAATTFTFNSTTTSIYGHIYTVGTGATATSYFEIIGNGLMGGGSSPNSGDNKNFYIITINNPDDTAAYKTYTATESALVSTQRQFQYSGNFNTTTAITSFQLKAGNSTWSGGTAYVYGVK
jgi:hypothetical protein